MENNDIEVFDHTKEDVSSAQLPVNFLQIGTVDSDDVKVYIKQDVYKALEKYSLEDTSCERGTILIGSYSNIMGMNVVISGWIEAKYKDASAATLTFTHKTWEYVNEERETNYIKEKIVGWQHTHPNYGVFLSNYDMFIQENFFNLPFQIAYVIDPIQRIRGFFQWKDQKVQKLKGYYVYDDVGVPIIIDDNKTKSEKSKEYKEHKKSNVPLIIAIVALCFVVGGYVSLLAKINSQNETINKIMMQYSNQETLNYSVEKELPDIQNGEEEKNTFQAATLFENAVLFEMYEVKHGDTIYKICKENHIDYEKNIYFILSINRIKNADLLYEGQILYLPKQQNS